jgi:hypothetical protein
MEACSDLTPPWDGHASWDGHDGKNNWAHEDGVVSKYLRGSLVRKGFVYAPVEDAVKFAYGGNKYGYCPTPFGFHGFYAIHTLQGRDGEHYGIPP